MRARKAIHSVVIVAALAVLTAATLCPAQCLFAAGTTTGANHCHDEGSTPVAHPMLEAACCPTLLTARVIAPVASVTVALPLATSPAWTPVDQPASRRIASREHSPPGIPSYLRTHALLI